jgi:hypothetical protein
MTEPREPEITCFLFSDLPPWERDGVTPIIDELKLTRSVKVIDVRPGHKGALKKAQGVSWVLSKNWARALGFLGGTRSSGKVHVSLFGIPEEQRILPLLFWKRLNRA